MKNTIPIRLLKRTELAGTLLEATGGFEPPHKGFADLSLTTWVRRQIIADFELQIANWLGNGSFDRYAKVMTVRN